MAYDEHIGQRLREALADHHGITKKKMFGGLSFMLGGNMCCGVEKANLVVRVGPDAYEDALADPHARPMTFTGRPMRGMVYVDDSGYATDEAMAGWVQRGVAFASSLPAKTK